MRNIFIVDFGISVHRKFKTFRVVLLLINYLFMGIFLHLFNIYLFIYLFIHLFTQLLICSEMSLKRTCTRTFRNSICALLSKGNRTYVSTY